MKTIAVVVAAAALASAQVTQDPVTGKFMCDKPNVNYCAGDSLGTDIIIRCDANKVGQPGRCTDNLAGEPPLGVNAALCYQSSPMAGDAACEKNCVVYNASPFTLPASVCTPYYTATTSGTTTSYPTTTYPTSSYPTTTYPTSSYPTTTYPTSSYPTSSKTSYTTMTTSTYCPPTSSMSPPPVTHCTSCGGGQPTYPTTTAAAPTFVTAGAAVNRVGGALAALGVVAAAML